MTKLSEELRTLADEAENLEIMLEAYEEQIAMISKLTGINV